MKRKQTVPAERPSLSACLIVKNEAARLPRCLASLRGVANELVVVDTGSDDETVAVASQFGARVLRFDWRDDFALARNFAIDAATCEWILSIDADEWLSPGAARPLFQAISAPRVWALKVTLLNHLDGGRRDKELLTRVFRRDPRVRFKGRIHEQVSESLAACVTSSEEWPEAGDVVLEHDGYKQSLVKERQKDARNKQLLALAVGENPDDVYLRYKLSRELQGEEGLAHLERTLEALLAMSAEELRGRPWAEQALINGALTLSSSRRAFLVEQLVATSRAAFGDHPALQLAAARAHLAEGRAVEARAAATRSVLPRRAAPDYDRAALSAELECCAARAECSLGDYGASLTRLTRLRKARPEYLPALYALIELAIAVKDYKGALRLAVTRLREHPADREALALAATVAERVGDDEAAARWRRVGSDAQRA
jgi:tetratricopeptide (TPR) repeat protein